MAANDRETLSLAYTLVYHFLLSRSHDRAAKSVRKAAKGVVDLKNAPAPEKSLIEVVEKWRLGSNEKEESGDEEDSSDDSSSEASSSEAPVQKNPATATKAAGQADSSSSASEEDEPAAPPPPPASKPSKKRKRQSEPGPLTNGHSSAPTAVAPSTPAPATNGTTAPAGTPANGHSAPSGPPATEPPHKKARQVSETPSSPSKPDPHQSKGGRKQNVPFSRIKPEEVAFADPRLKDNRFEARGAGETDYGARANRDLIVTRGAGFRKEKNKKKRGSYVGGEITLKSHSIKFDD